MNWVEQFELTAETDNLKRYRDDEFGRTFVVTPHSIVRVASRGDEWSVSEHSKDFFDSPHGKMLTPPSRYDSKEDAWDWAKYLVKSGGKN
jgi:hypothetical protein